MTRHILLLVALLIALGSLLIACAQRARRIENLGLRNQGPQRPYRINGHTYYPLPSAMGFTETGYASWYGPGFHGKNTSSGEIYNMHALTAAHKILPLNTFVLVENLNNGRRVIVRINDRGPFVKNRIIDLSFAAAKRLGIIGPGTAKVRITALAEAGSHVGRHGTDTGLSALRHGRFYVQVGSFLDPGNARGLKRRLARIHKPVVIVRQPIGGRIFFRVLVFAARDYNVAKDVESRFESMGFTDAFVVAQ